ncbi:unnamed protein product [Closterium sp. NIES-53]
MSTEEANVEAGNIGALEEDLVARHSRGELSDIKYELMQEGLRARQCRDHPLPRVEDVEQVAGGTSAWDMAVDGANSDDEELDGLMLRGVLRGLTRFSTDSVGDVQECVHRAAASRERVNVGQRSIAGGGNAEEYNNAGFQAWQFIMRTYMAKDDLYIGQLEQALTNLEMGEHESATSYCNRAQQILVNLRMANTSSPSPPTMAQQHQPKHGGGFGEGWEKWKGAKDGQSKGGKVGFKGNCYMCGQPGHIAKYCWQRADKDSDKGGEGSGGSSTSGKGGDGSKRSGQSSCAMVKPAIEHPPPIMLELEAGEGLQAVAAAVKANSSVVLLDSGCSHHLMGDRSAFVEMSSGVAAKDGSRYFLVLKDHKTRYVWAYHLAKKSDALVAFQKWLPMAERQCKTTVKVLRTDRGGKFLEHGFTLFLDKKGIIHGLTCPRSAGGKLAPKAHWGLHLGVSAASKGWQVLDLESNRLITTVESVFYETMSLAGWKAWHQQEHGGRSMPYEPLPSLFPGTHEEEVEEEEVVAPPAMPYVPTSVPTPHPSTVYPRVVPPTAPPPFSPPLATPPPPVIPSPLPPSILLAPAPPSSSSSAAPPVGEGGTVVSPSVIITDGQRLVTEQLQDKSSMDGVQESGGQETGEQQTGEQQIGEQQIGEEQIGEEQIGEQQTGEPQTGEQEMWEIRDGGRVLVSGTITAPPLRRSTRITRGVPPVKYAWAVVIEPAGLDDEEEEEEWTDLDPDVLADPERQWDIAKMTVKEALGCWKGDKVKEAMDEEMRSLIEQGTWELVPHPLGVNVMKNRWILNTKFRPDGIVEREKARLMVKGFTQVAGVDYEETHAPVGSYVTARVLLAIAAALDLDPMQLDVKNAFLHGVLDRDLDMEQPSYYEDGTPHVCKLVKSLHGLKQSPMLWYEALDGVLLGAGWKKSQVDEALYFKSDAKGEMCWLLVYVDDFLAASRSQSMLGELRELLQSAPTRRLWLHQEAYVDKVHRRFFDGEQPLRVPRTPLSSDPFGVETFEDVGWQSRQEEEYKQKFGGGLESLELVGYADGDDVGDKLNRTSIGGYVFVLEGAAVSWASQRIHCATLSPSESEYVAAVEAGKEVRRLRFLLVEFQLLRSEEPTTLFLDNSSAISVAGGLGLKGSLKHMERRHMWLQHMVKRRKLQL